MRKVHEKVLWMLNFKRSGGGCGGGEGSVNLMSIWSPCGFSKNMFSREGVKFCFFVTFNIIIGHIFPENFIKIPLIVQKIWRFTLSALTIFIDISDFLTFPCYKETNDPSIKLMIFFYFQYFFTFNLLKIVCLTIV